MCSPIVYLYYCYCTFINLYVGFLFFYVCNFIAKFLVLLSRTWTVKNIFLNYAAILVRNIISLDIDKVPRWDEHFVIQRSVKCFITLFCVLGVVLQTILDVYIGISWIWYFINLTLVEDTVYFTRYGVERNCNVVVYDPLKHWNYYNIILVSAGSYIYSVTRNKQL